MEKIKDWEKKRKVTEENWKYIRRGNRKKR